MAFLFTSGLELAWHYLEYYRYTRDEQFLRETAYPMLHGVCEFVAALMKQGSDGRYHLEPGNALETWWLVRDPADTLAGIRAIFPEFARLARRYGTDAVLRARAERIVGALAEAPRGLWNEDGRIAAEENVYAPATVAAASWKRSNAENPALYRIAPFGLSGAGSDDYELARRSFEKRILPVGHGWSMDAIWAARLGLPEQTAALLTEHLEKFQRFRYGGWTSNDSRVYPGGLSVNPFLDAGGVSAVGLQEALLQSHGGVIRVLPAASAKWSGSFRLRAEGGFLVDAEFTAGRATAVAVRSLFGGECAIDVGGRVSRFATRAGESYPVPAPSGGLALNEDNSHYFSTRAGKRLTAADVDSFVDQYAGTQVRELFLSPNSMRTSYAQQGVGPHLAQLRPERAGRPAAAREHAAGSPQGRARLDPHRVAAQPGRHRRLRPLDCPLPPARHLAVAVHAHERRAQHGGRAQLHPRRVLAREPRSFAACPTASAASPTAPSITRSPRCASIT